MINAAQRSAAWRSRFQLAVTLTLLLTRPVDAQAVSAHVDLTPDQQAVLARTFAPVLVFHPDEPFFPLDPRTILANNDDPLTVISDDAFGERFGSPAQQVRSYRALSPAQKLARAVVQYAVEWRDTTHGAQIVIEYRCYYVYNEFRFRGSLFGVGAPDNHFGDLERLFVVLEPRSEPTRPTTDPERWRIARIVANAHDGTIPPNQYVVAQAALMRPPVHVLVERGSHAMAIDVNRDGRFSPGVDATPLTKLTWGIRDRGDLGRRSHGAYMEPRDPLTSVALSPPATASDEGGASDDTGYLHSAHYRLVSESDVRDWLDRHREVLTAAMVQTPWWHRTFGDGRLEQLELPLNTTPSDVLRHMLRRSGRNERGLVAGVTTMQGAPTAIVGVRVVPLVSPRALPDVMIDTSFLVRPHERVVPEAVAFATYPLDAITKAFIGWGWVADADRPQQGRVDTLIGGEVRLGHIRIRQAFRLADRSFDARLVAVF